LHPLYPDGVRAIKLNDWIACPPCMEQARACAGRHDCLALAPAGRVAQEVLAALETLERTPVFDAER
jgi:hypothetical protein